MSKVEELLAKYNPNGVFQSDLREVSSIIRGKRVTKRDVKERGDYPVISGGESPMGYYDTFNREANTITIAQYGAAGYVDFQKNKFWANDVCYSILPFESVDNKYLYYTLKSKQNYIYSIRNTDAVPFSLPINSLYSIQIPLPHIKVQEEIVKILDSFTNLIDALNEELSLRQKQFEYYREKLLTDNRINRTCKTISELSIDIFSGATPSTKNKKYWDNGDIPWMNSGDIHQKIINCISNFITEEGYQSCSTKMVPIHSIVIALAGQGKTRGTVGITNTELCTNQSLCAIVTNDNIIIPKYLFYFLDKEYNNLRRVSSGDGTRGGLNLQMIKNYIIEYPSISIQQSIVEKLDAFESLISSLKEEIALRQKQYEYYREKLLTFD